MPPLSGSVLPWGAAWNSFFFHPARFRVGFPGGSDSKEPTPVWETWIQSLGWEDPLQEGMAAHSSILAWRIPMDRGYSP